MELLRELSRQNSREIDKEYDALTSLMTLRGVQGSLRGTKLPVLHSTSLVRYDAYIFLFIVNLITPLVVPVL
jgi:hypothetical protein